MKYLNVRNSEETMYWQYYRRHVKSVVSDTLYAKSEFDHIIIPEDYSQNNIRAEQGVHCFMGGDLPEAYMGNSFVVRGVVKAGTPFYVDILLDRIMVPYVEITNVFVTHSNWAEVNRGLKESRDYVVSLIKGMEENTNGVVSIGDLLLSNKKFVKPEEIVPNMKRAIGVVSFLKENGEPNVISLDEVEKQWCVLDDFKNEPDKPNERLVISKRDYCGLENTQYMLKTYKHRLDELSALQYCNEYSTKGTREGDWFMMSSGEMIQTVRNAYIINLTLQRYKDIVDWTDGVDLLGVKSNYLVLSMSGRFIPYCVSRFATLQINDFHKTEQQKVRPALNFEKVRRRWF